MPTTAQRTPLGPPIIGGLAIIAAAVQDLARTGRGLTTVSATPAPPPAHVDVWVLDEFVGLFLTDGHLFFSAVTDLVR